jgi:hypothetical protein
MSDEHADIIEQLDRFGRTIDERRYAGPAWSPPTRRRMALRWVAGLAAAAVIVVSASLSHWQASPPVETPSEMPSMSAILSMAPEWSVPTNLNPADIAGSADIPWGSRGLEMPDLSQHSWTVPSLTVPTSKDFSEQEGSENDDSSQKDTDDRGCQPVCGIGRVDVGLG